MISAKTLLAFVAAFSLMAGGVAFVGCQSETSGTPSSNSGDTMSGTGGGNGTFGSNPAQAMHSNPYGTPVSPQSQPAQ